MPPRKPVPSLLDLTVTAVGQLVKQEALRVAKFIVDHLVFEDIEVQ